MDESWDRREDTRGRSRSRSPGARDRGREEEPKSYVSTGVIYVKRTHETNRALASTLATTCISVVSASRLTPVTWRPLLPSADVYVFVSCQPTIRSSPAHLSL